MTSIWFLIIALALCTFTIRLSGVLLGERLPTSGPWARGLNALPGCLIAALVSVLMLNGGPIEWLAGAIALMVAIVTKNLPLTMLVGIAAVYFLRLWL